MAGNATVVKHMRAIGQLCKSEYGLKVVEISGWTTRGRSSTMNPKYTIEHHTAASVDITNMLINGRPDLNGPLCNFELRKDGTVGLLASGRANHAGVASVSATESYGIEATGPVPTGNTGVDAFPNYKAYVGLVAAICRHHGWGMDRVKAHKEIAPDRKIDPVFDMNAFRRAVDAAKKGGGEDEMTDKQMAELKRYIDLKMRETVRYMDHSDPKTPFQGHSLNKVRAEIADLRKLVIAEGARGAVEQPVSLEVPDDTLEEEPV